MRNGWEDSASAWIADMGERGDFSREFVLDAPMMERVRAKHFTTALDVGCGEGRFCRMLQTCGIATVGIDPIQAFISRARMLHPGGDYRLGHAEALDVPDGAFDLVVSYLTLIDIEDVAAAIHEMVRVLRPGGTLLIANLTSFNTAAVDGGWTHENSGNPRFSIDHYLTERGEWVTWRGIRIINWHRPLSIYMSLLIAEGLTLRYFSEPSPTGGDPAKAERYRRVPWSMVMEWEKPMVTDVNDGDSFSAEQAAAANKALRAVLGLPAQQFSAAQFVGMISEEIEQLRSAGKTDADIAEILANEVGVQLHPELITRYYAGEAQKTGYI